MAPSNGALNGSHPTLESHEASLVDLAAHELPQVLALPGKEAQILELYDRIHEQELETALLSQEYAQPASVDDVDKELARAEQDLLEARATYSVRTKAIEAVLMADPSIQSIYSTTSTPISRALLPLIHRRDILSLIHENLARSHATCAQALSNAEVENLRIVQKNQELVQELLVLTGDDESWKDEITDQRLKSQLEKAERGNRDARADYVRIKHIISAAIVASGIDWASDEQLRDLVVDEEDI
ncbi:hypothetical protein AJ80_00904 [Polytolypa hystricis UAMH7299]|uniref:Centromere protein H C-terminal domain-containing protein n=1 Tax=Polytolypa hystricis (strain UAMH7299) TaxID=1447883 RepID=A0A2B7Z0H3_POLH7|nr:hypothetical protein AJ80_00904 [Polytolypa hystricis UAMH7299]